MLLLVCLMQFQLILLYSTYQTLKLHVTVAIKTFQKGWVGRRNSREEGEPEEQAKHFDCLKVEERRARGVDQKDHQNDHSSFPSIERSLNL